MIQNCKSCGAPIKNGRCEYCGTEYNEPVVIKQMTVADYICDIREDPTLNHFTDFVNIAIRLKCSNCGRTTAIHQSLSADTLQLTEGRTLGDYIYYQIQEMNKGICDGCGSLMRSVVLPNRVTMWDNFPRLMMLLPAQEETVELQRQSKISFDDSCRQALRGDTIKIFKR